MLSYVLMSSASPCSLAFGTRFGSTQLVHLFAHDRSIEHLSPGTVLHTMMMRDIIDAKVVRRVDYGFGEPRYRLGNQLEERVTVMRSAGQSPTGLASSRTRRSTGRSTR